MTALGTDSLEKRRKPANSVTRSGPIQPHSRSSGIGVISRARSAAIRSAAEPLAPARVASPGRAKTSAAAAISWPASAGPSSGSLAGWPAWVAVIERNVMWRRARVGTRNSADRVPGRERDGNGQAGVLTLAGAPIGQAADAPARLAETLAAADVIAAEDTRRVRLLATALDVQLSARIVS